jgi:hypothetical protein
MCGEGDSLAGGFGRRRWPSNGSTHFLNRRLFSRSDSRSSGHLALDCCSESLDIGLRQELLQSRIDGRDVDTGMFGETALQLQNGRQFLFGEEVDLQVKMRPLVGLLRHAVLGHQHESGEHDGFERDRKGQQAEWVAIEGGAADRVCANPEREPDDMGGDEGSAACEAAYRVSDPVEQRPSVTRLPLEVQDGLNVLELW